MQARVKVRYLGGGGAVTVENTLTQRRVSSFAYKDSICRVVRTNLLEDLCDSVAVEAQRSVSPDSHYPSGVGRSFANHP